jgi:hypothetical protein
MKFDAHNITGIFYNDLHEFNPNVDKKLWINMSGGVSGIAPSPRAGHGFTLIKDWAFIFGGQGMKGSHLPSMLGLCYVLPAHTHSIILAASALESYVLCGVT